MCTILENFLFGAFASLTVGKGLKYPYKHLLFFHIFAYLVIQRKPQIYGKSREDFF
jgi:hypothetical protein